MCSLSPAQLTKSGEELIALIDQEISVSALSDIADKEQPTLAELRKIAEKLARRRPKATALDRRIHWLSETLGFDDTEAAILGFFARCVLFHGWRQLARQGSRSGNNPDVLSAAKLLDLPISIVEQRLAPGAHLLATDLVCDDHDGDVHCSGSFKRLIRSHAETPDDLLQLLMPKAEASSLEWQDFEHLGEIRDLAVRLLAARKPVSILLYGEPGTGKTEFARRVAEQAGFGAIFAGLTDESGLEPERSERLSHLMLLRALCVRQTNHLIVVDEADDVIEFGEKKNASKQWINRLVEAPVVPTIWIVNHRRHLDKTVLRRMTLAIGFDRPSLPIRERIARRAAKAQDMTLTDAEAVEIAAFQTAPAVVASGLRAASLVGGGADIAKCAIKSVMKALGQSPRPERAPAAIYDPALSCADTDLVKLAERLIAAPMRNWSLLLTGPSGTGKSAFARHLARQIGMEVEERRCSDLISPFIGQTEANIAEAFAEAAEREALLLIDEVDSFLHRRESAQRSWEINQVNEMLVQMEHLQMPFVATTNLAQNLDPAVQRRFTMRVAFKAMTEGQARQLFRAHFTRDWPAGIPIHLDQTPGDFGVVAHRAALLGEDDPLVLLRWLREEIEARGGGARKPVGFCMPKPVEPTICTQERKVA